MIDPGLRGRVALVTGCNQPAGIGAAIARALVAQGVVVALAVASPEAVSGGTATMAVGPAEVPGGAATAGLAADSTCDGCAVFAESKRAAR